MAKPQTAETIPLQLPLGGINTKQPLLAMDPSYSPYFVNFDAETTHYKLRKGYTVHANISGEDQILALGVWGDPQASTSKLFAYTKKASDYNRIYDVTTSTPVEVFESIKKTATIAAVSNYANILAFTTNADAVDNNRTTADGSTWSAWGWTLAGNAIGSLTTVSYKGIVYLFEAQYMRYSALGGTTDATTSVDVSTLFKLSPNVIWAGVLSSSSQNSDATFLAFGNNAGEILVYGGDDPGATNWTQIANFKVSAPLGYNAILAFRNDIWLLTRTGIVSIRKLFEAGSQAAEDLTVSSNIDSLWTRLINNSTGARPLYFGTYAASCTYWQEENKIYVLIPGYMNSENINDTDWVSGMSMFVYNCLTQSWSYYTSPWLDDLYLGAVTYFHNKIYFYSNNMIYSTSSAYKDEDADHVGNYYPIPYTLKFPYQNFDSYRKNKSFVGYEVILNTDFVLPKPVPDIYTGASLGMYSQADAGRKTSATTYPEITSGFNNIPYSCGIEGTYISGVLTGASAVTSASGLSIYGIGATFK